MNRRTAGVTLLVSSLLAEGCTNQPSALNAEYATVWGCAYKPVNDLHYDNPQPLLVAKDAPPIGSQLGFLANIRKQVAILHDEAQAADGGREVEVPFHKGVVAIRTGVDTSNSKTLEFVSVNFPDANSRFVTRLNFYNSGPAGTYPVSIGAVACNSPDSTFRANVFAADALPTVIAALKQS